MQPLSIIQRGIALVLLWVPFAHAQLTVEQVVERFASIEVTGATVITHGFSPTDGGGGYMLPLAEAIRGQLNGNVWLLDYDLPDDGATGVFNAGSILPPADSAGQSGHVILLFDWAAESNEDSRWWAQAAGDALFTLGTNVGIFEPRLQNASPVQFIGHSFGTVATTEAVERLAGYGVPVDQVTLIDPHDFDQANVPVFDEAQRMSDLGKPQGYGATIWDNVEKADVYYQTRGNQGTAVSIVTGDPLGRPIPGAFNRHLDGADELPSGNPYGGGASSDHGYAWSTFYASTVTGNLPAGAHPPANGNNGLGQTGWAYSIHNPNQIEMPDPNFYSVDQDHLHSNPLLVSAAGTANPTGLASLGLTQQQVIDGRWEPDFAPGNIVNGNFASGNRTSPFVDIVAGWSHHGGGGDSEINSESVNGGTNFFMRLDDNDVERTHNSLYIPINAAALLFDFRVFNPSGDDSLDVSIGDTFLGTLDMEASTDWTLQSLSIPEALRDSVATISFELSFGGNIFDSPEVDIDTVRFGLVNPLLSATPDNAGVVDFGNIIQGQEHTLSDIVRLENIGDAGSILDVLGTHGEVDLFDSPDFADPVALRRDGGSVFFDLQFKGSHALGQHTADFGFDTTAGMVTYQLIANVVAIPEPASWFLFLVAAGSMLVSPRRTQRTRSYGGRHRLS